MLESWCSKLFSLLQKAQPLYWIKNIFGACLIWILLLLISPWKKTFSFKKRHLYFCFWRGKEQAHALSTWQPEVLAPLPQWAQERWRSSSAGSLNYLTLSVCRAKKPAGHCWPQAASEHLTSEWGPGLNFQYCNKQTAKLSLVSCLLYPTFFFRREVGNILTLSELLFERVRNSVEMITWWYQHCKPRFIWSPKN